MYERKIPDDPECGLMLALKVLGGKWKACIIEAIDMGYKRPSEIHRVLAAASPRVLNMQLRELEEYGMVSKEIFAEIPLRVEYSLTEVGMSLLPVISVIDKWGYDKRAHIMRISQELEEASPGKTAEVYTDY